MLNTTPVSPSAKKLPGLTDSKHLLTMLFGADTVCKLRKEPLSAKDCVVVASYRENNGRIRRLLACDLAFANSAGAALSAIPPTAANNATKAGKLAENVLENLFEVMNIAVNMLIESFGGRLELVAVSRLSDVPAELLDALSSDQRVKIDIAIPRYEPGRLDLIAVDFLPAQ
jgi:hypothetical protein